MVEKGLFVCVNGFFLGLNIADSEFSKFIGKRLSSEYFLLHQDVEQHLLSIFWTYRYLLIQWFLLLGLLYYFYPSDSEEKKHTVPDLTFKSLSFFKKCFEVLLWFTLIILGMRGGIQLKPLHPMDAFFNSHHELGLLTTNTPFNLIKSRPNEEVNTTRYFKEDREPILNLKNANILTRPPLGTFKEYNVVVIIVESLSLEYTGAANDYPGYTPFLDQLAKKSLFFPHHFANARRSIDGVPAVLCGIPALMAESLLTTSFSNNRLECLPKVLREQGYSSYFLHGAKNGSMRFDTFSHIAGFDNFIGLDQYPKNNREDFDPYWGVADEPMLQYAIQVMDRAPKPAFLSVFTLSSHHPYFIPKHLRGRFKKGTLEIHESIGYADYALQQFFLTAQTKPWFHNTIFVITADHTQKTDQKKYQNVLGYYRVPLLIHVPQETENKIKLQKISPFDEGRIVQQIDIMPSLLDWLGVENKKRFLLGQSTFDLNKSPKAYIAVDGYWILDDKNLVYFDRKEINSEVFTHNNTYDLVLQKISQQEIKKMSLVEYLLSAAHYFNMGMINNTLYDWEKEIKY
ncbi:MAG: LTA synthase family protein [Bdellovibrionales bacterium]|nr:LTA synthase family protein [Bdellovibrionales bacterium]